MSIIETLKRSHYVATIAQVEQLARAAFEGMQSAATYLSCLVAGCQSKTGSSTNGKRGRGRRTRFDKDAQLAVINATHSDYYAAVLRGVGDAQSDEREAQRRATFARSAASTLRSFVRAGGDLRTLDPTTVTKPALMRSSQPPEPEDRLARRWMRAHGSLLRAAKRMARDNPEFAARSIEVVIEELQAMLDDLPDEGATAQAGATTVVSARHAPRDRVADRPGAMLHSPA